jgi:hypothetical protein
MAGRDLEATAAGLNAVDLRAAVAQEFLDAARVALDARGHNAAASNAVRQASTPKTLFALPGSAGARPATIISPR